MKSKANPISTMMTTYVTGSRILEGYALQHVAHALELVQCPLERVVELLPLHHVERVRLPQEQAADGVLIDGVALLLEPLDLAAARGNDGRLLDGGDPCLDMIRRARDGLAQLHGGTARFPDVEHRHPPGGPVDQVNDVVQLSREEVDILAIDRRHEAAIDARTHIVREHIGFVFDSLDSRDVVLEPIGFGEQSVQQSRRFLESLSQLVEQDEEAFVAWNEAHWVSSEVAEATRRPRLRRGAGFVTFVTKIATPIPDANRTATNSLTDYRSTDSAQRAPVAGPQRGI